MNRYLAVIIITACLSKPSAPPPAQGSGSAVVPPTQPTTSKTIDLPEAGITEVELVPTLPPVGPRRGEIDIRWRSAKRIEAGVVCRVESYNVFSDETHSIEQVLPDGQHAVMWQSPLGIEPDLCEARFFGADHATIASACHRAGTMTAGPCPAGTFPPPKLDPGQMLDIERASMSAGEGFVIIERALYTVAAPLDHVSFDATCDGVTTKATTAEKWFVPLAKLHAGESVFAGNVLLPVDKPIVKRRPDKCELRASQNGKSLGTFCIAAGQTHRGPCPT